MSEFRDKALAGKGAILGLICRGKLSEGIDFPDELCRAVVIVGIPYANVSDPLIKEKKAHLDNIAKLSINKNNILKGD